MTQPVLPVRLGDRITYSAVLQRVWEEEPSDLTTWRPVSIAPRSGVVVGRRNVERGTDGARQRV